MHFPVLKPAAAANSLICGDSARKDLPHVPASCQSRAWAERGFCKRCGTNLFYRLKETDHYFLNMGTFEDQSLFTVTDEIYIDEKPAGYDIAGDHPRLTGEEFLASLKRS